MNIKSADKGSTAHTSDHTNVNRNKPENATHDYHKTVNKNKKNLLSFLKSLLPFLKKSSSNNIKENQKMHKSETPKSFIFHGDDREVQGRKTQGKFHSAFYGKQETIGSLSTFTQHKIDAEVQLGKAEKVNLQGSAGRLCGHYYHGDKQKNGKPQKVVLFLHGANASGQSNVLNIKGCYNKSGIDVLGMDFRGFGKSDGMPSEKGLYDDAKTMFDYLINDRGFDPENIIIHGYAMGAPVAAKLATEAASMGQNAGRLFLDRPLLSMKQGVEAHGVRNLKGILSTQISGKFNISKNLKGLPKQTNMLMLTDNEEPGNQGEILRKALLFSGYNVSGQQTELPQLRSKEMMKTHESQIIDFCKSNVAPHESD